MFPSGKVPIRCGRLSKNPPFCRPISRSPRVLLVLRLTGRVTVEGEQVGGAAGDARDDVGGGELADAVAESDGAGVALEGGEVGTETGDVRRGHRSTRDGVLRNRSERGTLVDPRDGKLTVEPPGQVERTLLPGAKMSTMPP